MRWRSPGLRNRMPPGGSVGVNPRIHAATLEDVGQDPSDEGWAGQETSADGQQFLEKSADFPRPIDQVDFEYPVVWAPRRVRPP